MIKLMGKTIITSLGSKTLLNWTYDNMCFSSEKREIIFQLPSWHMTSGDGCVDVILLHHLKVTFWLKIEVFAC